MIKFQPLILPLFLWIATGIVVAIFPPKTPLIIIVLITLVFGASLFTLRLIIKKSRALVLASAVFVFLLLSWLFGFNIVNTLLICALGVLLCISL